LLLELEQGWEAGSIGAGRAGVGGGAGEFSSDPTVHAVVDGEEEPGQAQEARGDGDSEDERPPVPLLAPSRRRLRSRNAFIDSELGGSGYGADSYADLEDFIVVKKGRRY
jgi:hypothetical protein